MALRTLSFGSPITDIQVILFNKALVGCVWINCIANLTVLGSSIRACIDIDIDCLAITDFFLFVISYGDTRERNNTAEFAFGSGYC